MYRMRFLLPYCLLLLPMLFTACNNEPSAQDAEASKATDSLISSLGTAPGQLESCMPTDRTLEGNFFTGRKAGLQLFITADSSTYDPDMGDSHRLLEIYKMDDCSLIDRIELPVNVSPDFPYYFAEIIYNNTSRLVGIKGFNQIYCYDLENRRLLPPLEPRYLMERYAEDAQSGMIRRLEVWENYLIGFAEDQGVFVFDLSNPDAPNAVLPLAEYPMETDNNFHSLFLLPSYPDTLLQVVIPDYKYIDNTFLINPLLQSPLPIHPVGLGKPGNDQYVVFSHPSNGKPIAIDLEKAALHPLNEAQKAMSPEALLRDLKK